MRAYNFELTTTRGVAAALTSLLFVATVSAGEKIEWRSSYDTARREATEKNKPLLLDFGTEDCHFCKKMHQTTFRDPIIVKLINEQFIPLKVDANREPKLTQALRIQAYPTMILAGNDGKILIWIEGYVEVARLNDQLQRASLVQTPDWMAHDYQEAMKCKEKGDIAGAISRLSKVAQADGAATKDLPVKNKAREILQQMEDDASKILASAKERQKTGQVIDSYDDLKTLVEKHVGTQAHTEGVKMLAGFDSNLLHRARNAKDLFAKVQKELSAKQYLACLEHSEFLAAEHSDLWQGREAARIVQDIKADPEKMARVCQATNDLLAQRYIALADSHIQKGQHQLAMAQLDQAGKLSPSPAVAATVQARLGEIRGKTPGLPTSFPKPN